MLSVDSNRTDTIIFETAQINEGNGYNPSTGVFTAFHRGIYKFSLTIMAQMDSIVCVSQDADEEEKNRDKKKLTIRFCLCSFRPPFASFTIVNMFSACFDVIVDDVFLMFAAMFMQN